MKLSTLQWRQRFVWLKTLVTVLLLILIAKTLFSVVLEYRNYFPANFKSSFLAGREGYFFGIYAFAFYAHLSAGPLAIVLGLALYFSNWIGLQRFHRILGRVQGAVVLFGVVPTGLVMATRAYSGAIAGLGFGCQAIATAYCMGAAVYFAKNRQFEDHRFWSERCLILLLAPVLLRVVSSLVFVTHFDSVLAYRLSAWFSWLIPLAAHQIFIEVKKPRIHYVNSEVVG